MSIRNYLAMVPLLSLAFAAAPAVAETGNAARFKALYEEAVAKGEKELNIGLYGSGAFVDIVIAAFQQQFPEIRVNYQGLLGSALDAAVDAEFATGRRTFDVRALGVTSSEKYVANDWLEPFTDAESFGVPARFIYRDGAFVAHTRALVAGAYNTNEVADHEFPGSLAEFTDPKWQGKVGLQRPSGGVNVDGWLTELYGNGLIDEALIEKFRDWPTETGQSALVTSLSQNKFSVSPDVWAALAFSAIREGAPIGLKVIPDASYFQTDFFGQLRGAPHPAAARLFLAWLVSKDGGQPLIPQLGLYSIHADIPAPEGLPDADEVKIVNLPVDKYLDTFKTVRAITSRIWP